MKHIFWFQHNWQATDISHRTFYEDKNGKKGKVLRRITEILYKCDCDKFKTGFINGHWSLSHFVKKD